MKKIFFTTALIGGFLAAMSMTGLAASKQGIYHHKGMHQTMKDLAPGMGTDQMPCVNQSTDCRMPHMTGMMDHDTMWRFMHGGGSDKSSDEAESLFQ